MRHNQWTGLEKATARALVVLMAAWNLPAAAARNRSGPADGETIEPVAKVRVTSPAASRRLEDAGAKLVADYNGFRVYEVPARDAAKLRASGDVEELKAQNRILLNSGAIDTSVSAARSGRQALGSFSGKRLHLIQFAGPVKAEWYDELKATGAQIVTYIPKNAYLVWGASDAVGRVQKLAAERPFVQWDGAYEASHRIQPGALPAVKNKGTALGADDKEPVAYDVQLVADAGTNSASVAQISALGELKSQDRFYEYLNVSVSMSPDHVKTVAALPDVVSVARRYEPRLFDERQNQIISGNLTGNLPTPGDYLAYLAGLGFTQAQFDASGFGVIVVDSGVDNGTATPNHFGLYRTGSTANADRLSFRQTLGTPGGSAGHGCDGHGNLNTHIVGGYVPGGAPFNAFPHADAAGFRYGMGVAPFVLLGNSVIFDPGWTGSSDAQLYAGEAVAYTNNMRISTNSWGFTAGNGGYNVTTQGYDATVRDAQPLVAGNQDYVILFAAGNDGPGAGSVGMPGTGKNILSAGASENVQAFGGADGCGTTDAEADSAMDIVGFSGRGPTNDGRVKPDLMAPGTHVSGGVAQAVLAGAPPVGIGNDDACFNATGVCGGPAPGFDFWPLAQEWYSASSGTSHSTPAIAGTSALLRQDFINRGLAPPSPAMTKAALMNTTLYMTGTGANDNLPSNNQGMGLVNLNNYMAARTTGVFHYDQVFAQRLTATGQVRTFTGNVISGAAPFRVTMAFTDRFGPTSGNAYVNDLDLMVTVGGNTYRGNVFTGANSSTGGAADPRNNVESVFVPAGVTGPFSITITGSNIVADGINNVSVANQQDFALFVQNGVEVAQPVMAVSSVNITSELCVPFNNAFDPNEAVGVDVCLQNVGTAPTVNLSATLQATGGVTNPSGVQNYGAVGVGATVCRPYTFRVSNALLCGDTLTASFDLTDGAPMGTVTYNAGVGSATTPVVFSENFDGVTDPTLPPGWTAVNAVGPAPTWVTDPFFPDTPPNSCFTTDPNVASDKRLTSPAFTYNGVGAQLTFRHAYDTESGWDGGILEISINGGAFTDIITAGGAFVANGYNDTLIGGSPLGAVDAWSGFSGGYVTTVVDLPAAGAGVPVQLRWRLGSDTSVAGCCWDVDSIVVNDYVLVCSTTCYEPNDIFVNKVDTPDPVTGGRPLTYTITVVNPGPATLSSVEMRDPLPSTARIMPGSNSVRVPFGWTCNTPYPGTSGLIRCTIPALPPNLTSPAVFGFTVMAPPLCSPAGPPRTITLSNTAFLTFLGGSDPNPANNTSTTSTLVTGPACFF